MAKEKTVYVCSNCGQDSPKWVGKCPSCGEWNTYVEEIVRKEPVNRRPVSGIETQKPKPVILSEIIADDEPRINMHDNEHWNKLNVKYWTPENHSNEYQQIGAQSYHTQVLGKISGSFLKMQNITLGYTLPENWMKKMKMKNARAYINVQNPFTFTDYLGPDPETIGEDVYKSLSLYPMTFTFGVNLTF